MADSHHPHAPHAAHSTDMRAAFTGLIAGAIALLIIVVTVVTLTNRHYAAEKPAAGAQH